MTKPRQTNEFCHQECKSKVKHIYKFRIQVFIYENPT